MVSEFFSQYPLAAFALAGTMLAVVAVVARRLGQSETIVLPRVSMSGDARGNRHGAMIASNTCPTCGNEWFYKGERVGLLYCANRECRAGWSVLNYGEGMVWAEPSGDRGPDYLYR